MPTEARLVRVEGLVQGVGFRPTVWRIAVALGLTGEVFNDPQGVGVRLEGEPAALDAFPDELMREKPPLARIDSIEVFPAEMKGFTEFSITASEHSGAVTTMITADAATCAHCFADIFDKANRRHRYAFTNCTHCGPRFTITRALPYDRPQTSMAVFPMCPECLAEYRDPADRRFHAQPNACPVCGPQLTFTAADGTPLPGDPVREAARAILEGKIVAMKGIGGFHLVCDARNPEAVKRLRSRKGRDEKPLAVMCAGVASARRWVNVNDREAELLTSPAHPIVLCRKSAELRAAVAADPGAAAALPGIADGLSELGVMLPYTPLHALLFHSLAGEPEGKNGPASWMDEPQEPLVVMTSANPGGEPLVIGNDEAVERLGSIADFILMHNREILVRCDDSVARVIDSGTLWVRRARGVTPEAVKIPAVENAPDVLATGSYLKNAAALTRGDELFLSQHIGDLSNFSSCEALELAVAHLSRILEHAPGAYACDLHPDFFSTQLAEKLATETGKPLIRIAHHAAHVGAAMAEAGRVTRTYGAALDGVGLGPDGGVWGGEFLACSAEGFTRLGRLEALPLPGGDRAAREPWRMAAAALVRAGMPEARFELLAGPDVPEMMLAEITKLVASPRTPLTTALGRWFDAAAALLGLARVVHDEATAAMRLESLAETSAEDPAPRADLAPVESGVLRLSPLLAEIARERLADPSREHAAGLAKLFEITVADGLARWIASLVGDKDHEEEDEVMLTGGCMLNRVLSREIPARLARLGIRARIPHAVPPGDGGLALGEAHLARLALSRGLTEYPFLGDRTPPAAADK
ncbi:carbamoyltransferase HypF [Sutterella sp.]|uniref:carbamoyltransferase HypF n=1 Tax=Sutterella sp. TaxID=1981025 RepID=UPI0026DF6554|nr:carbamoyltransferase HypF [Sutterella sp.]MDO5530920.1 carbamoyltransferase HypF [Sutterella sp.]